MAIEVQDKILAVTTLGSVSLYIYQSDLHSEASKYRDNSGKFVWWRFLIDLVVHLGMALFGATLVFYILDTATMVDYKEFQLVGSIIGGIVTREVFPILLDLLIEEIKSIADNRRKNR